MANISTNEWDFARDSTTKSTYFLRCRFCRIPLLSSDKIKASHQINPRECGNCLYLNEGEISSSSWTWIQDKIEQSGWTKGRIYCPKKNCGARIGGFDFVQGNLCSCDVLTIPAIWIQDSKVDIKLAGGGKTNLRKPTVQVATESKVTEFGQNISKQQQQSKLGSPVTKVTEKETLTGTVGTSQASDQTEKAVIKTPILHLNKEDNGEKPKNDPKISKQTNKEHNTSCITQRVKTPANRFDSLTVEVSKLVPVVPPKIKEIEDHLTCPVCLDCFYKPYKCPCDHVFCEPCLQQLYHARHGTLKCPVCRSPVSYIDKATQLRMEIKTFHSSVNSAREAFERTTKYKNWALPPIGALSFLKIHPSLVPPRDMKLITMTAILLSIVCGVILFIGLNLSGWC